MAVLIAAFALAGCAFVYELALGAAVTELAGSSTRGYSLSVGLFVCAMGMGAYASRWVKTRLANVFVGLEIAVGLAGAFALPCLHWASEWPLALYPAVIAVTTLVGTCIGLEVPLLVRLLAIGPLPSQLADVLAFDYFGGLAGSLLFAWLLEPGLGLQGAAVLAGITNLMVASLVAVAFRPHLQRPILTLSAIGLAAVLLMALLVPATHNLPFGQKPAGAPGMVVRER